MNNKFIPNSFQVPNAVIDELMNQLKDVEFRCYMYLIRQTTGWNKVADYISTSQFMKKTGRGKTSVTAAMKSLVAKGLVCVLEDTFQQVKGYFLNTEWFKKCTSSESELVQKVNLTSSKSERGSSESEPELVQKVNTQNNNIQNNNNTPLTPQKKSQPENCADALVAANATTGVGEAHSSKPKNQKTVAPVSEIVEAYNEILGDVMPKAVEINDRRKREIKRLWKHYWGSVNPSGKVRYANREDGLKWWRGMWKKAKANAHWCGNNDRNWTASLDWFLKTANFVKLLEFNPSKAVRG